MKLDTWNSPGNMRRNQSDYITVGSRFKNYVMNVKTYPGVDVEIDYTHVFIKTQRKLKNTRKNT